MKLKDYRETFYEFSGKLSDLSRNLAFAGIALVWVFIKTSDGGISIEKGLLLPLKFLVLSLGFDLFQYIYQTIAWAIFYHYYESKKTEEEDFTAPNLINYPSWFFLAIKVGLLLVAYFMIFEYVYGLLNF